MALSVLAWHASMEDFKTLFAMLRDVLMNEDHQKGRVQEGLLQARHKNLLLCVRCLAPILFISVLALFKLFLEDPRWDSFLRLVLLGSLSLQQILLSSSYMTLKLSQVRLFECAVYVQFAVLLIFNSLTTPSPIITTKFIMGSRFSMTCVFVDTKLAVLGQSLLMLIGIWSNALRPEVPNEINVVDEVQLFLATIMISFSFEYLVCSRIAATLDSAERECLLSSFRRMLRGVCDGELLLDDGLCVQGKADCLQNLLNRSDMDGLHFQEFLVPEERERFQGFLAAASTGQEPPPCLRVSLRSATGARVGVDLFHVPVPQITGAEHHLLAIREDAESRGQPEADIHSEKVVKKLAEEKKHRRRRGGSRASSQSSGGSAVFEAFPEVAQMELVVDLESPELRLQQASFSFSQIKGPSVFCLRKLLRATDWDTVRKQLTSSEQLQLRHLRLKLSENKDYLVAERVQASVCGTTAFLQGVDFSLENRRRQGSELEGISEIGEGSW